MFSYDLAEFIRPINTRSAFSAHRDMYLQSKSIRDGAHVYIARWKHERTVAILDEDSRNLLIFSWM